MTFLVPIIGSILLGLPGPIVRDAFGRDLDGRVLILVDWEGQIANPAVRISVATPLSARFPVKFVLRADDARIAFDLPSRIGPEGPTKEVVFADASEKTVHLAIFPDRDSRDEDHALSIEGIDASGAKSSTRLPIRVLDQDRDRPLEFPIEVDFSKDRTGFFDDEAKRKVVRRAAGDWAYFFDGEGLDPVAVGAESTPIWDPDGFNANHLVTNERPFRGYLLYAYGIDSPLLRSGGEPSEAGGFQSLKGARLPIRRSGGYEAEIKGNYNRKGWLVDLPDSEWWRATNRGGTGTDLESIAHHEIGHALIFNPANERFEASKAGGKLDDPAVAGDFGTSPKIDRADHLAGSIDPISLRGAFGNEYHGRMPLGRWTITRLDLIAARAVGYPLRETSAFAPLTILSEALPAGSTSADYRTTIAASGGIPAYDWDVIDGSLPPGLTLDRFDGSISGRPKVAGEFGFVVQVRDQDLRTIEVTKRFRLKIADG